MDMLFLKELGKKIWDCACLPLFYFPIVALKSQLRTLLWLFENLIKGKKASSDNSEHPSPSFC